MMALQISSIAASLPEANLDDPATTFDNIRDASAALGSFDKGEVIVTRTPMTVIRCRSASVEGPSLGAQQIAHRPRRRNNAAPCVAQFAAVPLPDHGPV